MNKNEQNGVTCINFIIHVVTGISITLVLRACFRVFDFFLLITSTSFLPHTVCVGSSAPTGENIEYKCMRSVKFPPSEVQRKRR